jgi:pre-rRNA-processing protein TSR4
MDRKKNNNSHTQGGRTNGSNKPKAADNKGLADTTLGLSNLSLGNNNTTTNPKPKNNTSGKKTSKKSTSSSNGSNVAAPSPVSSKKAGPILLGMPDSPMESQDDIDPYVTKIGGVPVRSFTRRMKKLFGL